MTLTGSDLRSGSFKLAYDIISGLSRAAIGSVYSKFPEEKFLYFPMTILDNVESSGHPETKGFMNADMTIPITMYNKSGKNLDIQSDAIITGLIGSRMGFLSGAGMKLTGIINAGQGTNIYGNRDVHYKIVNLILEGLE